jgi:hypothetical protein
MSFENFNKVIHDKVDDKTLIILCITLLGVGSLYIMDDPENIVQSIVTGLFGIAVGRGIKRE